MAKDVSSSEIQSVILSCFYFHGLLPFTRLDTDVCLCCLCAPVEHSSHRRPFVVHMPFFFPVCRNWIADRCVSQLSSPFCTFFSVMLERVFRNRTDSVSAVGYLTVQKHNCLYACSPASSLFFLWRISTFLLSLVLSA